MKRITVEEIRQRALAERDDNGEAGWQTKLARLSSLSDEQIAKARKRHFSAVAEMRKLAERVLAINVRGFSYPASHGGDLGKATYQEAAVAWFGMDAEITWPVQSPVIR